ncbi:MAG: hypothetical protein HYX91_00165 [Chloroflexi bacterium]|nr:hypothetical protein [Chloroflexota bacterium]
MILVECYADKTLVQCLTSLPREHIGHFGRGKSGVCNQLAARCDSRGLIDEDPRSPQHPYQKAGVSHGDFSRYDIKHLYFPGQNNELIILCPRLEDWILETARIEGIDVTRHGLPDQPGKLLRAIDHRLDKFRTLLNMLVKRKSARITALAGLLKGEPS